MVGGRVAGGPSYVKPGGGGGGSVDSVNGETGVVIIDAADIDIVDAAGDFTATEVEGALAELQSDAEADAQALADHLADPTDAHDASAISVISTTLVGVATDAQGVFEELDNGIADHLADTTDAHDASAISLLDTAATYAATDVEGALAEIGPLGDGVSLNLSLQRIHALTALGHSWLAGTSVGSTGTTYFEQQGLTAKVCGALGIHEDNLMNLATAGAALVSPVPTTGAALAGWGAMLQFVLPDNCSVINDPGTPISAHGLVESHGAGLIVSGITDILKNIFSAQSHGRTAWKHALRAYISRLRSAALWGSYRDTAAAIQWDAPIVFSGTASANLADVVRGTGPAGRELASGSVMTFTIPDTFTGGTIPVCFIGGRNAWTLLNEPGTMLIGDLTMTVDSAAEFDPAVNYIANIAAEGANTAEDVLITGGHGTTTWTVTRAQNGTAASAHGDNAVVTLIPVGTNVGSTITWSTSGGNGTITGTTLLHHQGYAGQQIPVVKRFVCTAADAGKTIVATIGSMISGDTADKPRFDSVWMEATYPSPVVVADIPVWPFAFIGETAQPNFNADIDTIVAEFDSAVQVALIDDRIQKGNALLNGAIAVTTGTTFSYDTAGADFIPSRGWVVRINTEDILVDSVGAGTITCLTAGRGYNGTTPATHPDNALIGNMSEWYNDHLHPNAYGHGLMAQDVIDAFNKAAIDSPRRLILNGGVWTQNKNREEPGYADDQWIQPILSAAVTNGGGHIKDRLYAIPIDISEDVTLSEIAVITGTTPPAALTVRLGIYDIDEFRARPQGLIAELGSVTPTVANTAYSVTCYKRLRPGRYWLAMVGQGTTMGSYKSFGIGGSTVQLSIPSLDLANPMLVAHGYVTDGVTGALPANWTTWTTARGSAGLFCPIIFPKVRIRGYGT